MMDLNQLIEKSNRKLANVHPYVKNKAIELIKKAYTKGIYVQVTQGFRSIEEQNELYAIGRTKPGKIVTNAKGGQSIHNYGLAFDIVILNNDGSLNWNTNDNRWKRVGQIGESIGLEWGGSWKTFKDMPHFEYTFGLTLKDLQNGKRPPNYPSSSPQPKNYYELGDEGEKIKEIQQKLIKLGYQLNGGADGIFGQSTLNAVKQFQSKYGLAVDGIVGENTLKKIDEVLKQISKDKQVEQNKKLQEVMKMKLVDFIGEDRMNKVATVLREAKQDGILESNEWEEKAKNRTLTFGEAIYVTMIMDHRRFRDYCKK
jgi:peptidoglycan LD-endopeptidase CwlK